MPGPLVPASQKTAPHTALKSSSLPTAKYILISVRMFNPGDFASVWLRHCTGWNLKIVVGDIWNIFCQDGTHGTLVTCCAGSFQCAHFCARHSNVAHPLLPPSSMHSHLPMHLSLRRFYSRGAERAQCFFSPKRCFVHSQNPKALFCVSSLPLGTQLLQLPVNSFSLPSLC